MISIEGPPLSEYKFKEAFNVWISKRDRRAFKAMFVCKSIVLKEPIVVKDVQNVLNQDDASETDCELDHIETKIKRLEELLMGVVKKC